MHKGRILFCVFLILVAATAIYLALDWPFNAALFPLSVSIPLLILAATQLWQLLCGEEEVIESAAVDLEFSSDVPPEIERRRVIADLRDELIAPLGSVVMPAGLRAGRPAGSLTVRGPGDPVELELVPGGIELLDLPPGERAVLEVRFREAADLGLRARHFAVEVAGGLGGLIVDLRDIPMALPERIERRRDLLAAWQALAWAGVDE